MIQHTKILLQDRYVPLEPVTETQLMDLQLNTVPGQTTLRLGLYNPCNTQHVIIITLRNIYITLS